MPIFALTVIVLGVILGVVGFTMAFRQAAFRRFIGQPKPPSPAGARNDDPLTYMLRIAGVMVMVFGIVMAGMMTLFNLL